MSDNCPDNIELHRPYIDEVTIRCPHCGKPMHRVPEVIDCWFDSGSMPFAQHHYPFENKDLFEQQFPAKFISEAVDQTRGWFYSLLAISTLIFNKAPYENVIVLGHVQDENGQKMSKSKGNAVDPFDALETYGADAIRWYFYVNSAPWLPNRFHGKAVVEGQRKFMGTLWNTYAFFVLYANIDNFDATKYELEYDKLPVMDKWLLSKLNTLVKDVDNHLENYRIPESARALQDFVDDMSNWYVRRSRDRFWAEGMPQDKINAYMTLYTALVTVAKVAAPLIPFMTEEIYQNLVRSIDSEAIESIHLCDFPAVDETMIDKELEAHMEEVLKLVVMGRACRNTANIKNRQPIGQMFVKAEFDLPEFYKDIVKEELNVKAKHLVEKYAAHEADCFTTVSDLTASECKQLLEKQPDIVTPNGFEDDFIPRGAKYTKARKEARENLRNVAEKLLGYKLDDDALFIGTSGRYEYRNKGIDVFLEALKLAINENENTKEIVAFILVPGWNLGARKDLQQKLANSSANYNLCRRFITHDINNFDNDLIVNAIQSFRFNNEKTDKVKVILVPSYLHGDDGIFNKCYYDLLIGLDLTIFASYYEPWGYTPLESAAFGIPTITTNLTGFGLWCSKEATNISNGVAVVYRNDTNYFEVADSIKDNIILFAKMKKNLLIDGLKA
jgi:glycosyltransferase involved in cell wall biosynthesis